MSEGQIYVCAACGKRSRDREGQLAIDPGWDVSCFMHAILCYEASYSRDDHGHVRAEAVKTSGAV